MPRLFFAIRTPEALLPGLISLQQQIADRVELAGLALRKEHLENSHCTLRFLGEIPEAKVPALIAAVESAFLETPANQFEISLASCGVFPERGRARVIWTGVEPASTLVAIRTVIDRGMAGVGIPKPREQFHPHLTLFRLRVPSAVPDLTYIPIPTTSPNSAWIEEVVLVESTLTPRGAIHSVRARFLLG